jgi:hypothetical protein
MVGELGEEAGGHTPEPREAELQAEEEHPMAEEVRPMRPPSEQARSLRAVPAAGKGHSRLDDARLVALQMAVAGRTRDEVAEHLKVAFEVADPDPILDHVFAEGFPPPPPSRGA